MRANYLNKHVLPKAETHSEQQTCLVDWTLSQLTPPQ